MSNVIPMDPKKRIEASLQPASPSDAQAAVAVLAKALPIMPSIQDPPAFRAIMADFLRPYPADVLIAAVHQAIQNFKHMPSIHEMIELCEGLVDPGCAGWSESNTRSNAKPPDAPPTPNEKPNARQKTRLVGKPPSNGCEVSKSGPASAWVMRRHYRAMSRSPTAFRIHWSTARKDRVSWLEALAGGERLGGTVLPANGPRRANKASDPARADCLGRVPGDCQTHQSRRSGRAVRS